jgi:hypothetical protein
MGESGIKRRLPFGRFCWVSVDQLVDDLIWRFEGFAHGSILA